METQIIVRFYNDSEYVKYPEMTIVDGNGSNITPTFTINKQGKVDGVSGDLHNLRGLGGVRILRSYSSRSGLGGMILKEFLAGNLNTMRNLITRSVDNYYSSNGFLEIMFQKIKKEDLERLGEFSKSGKRFKNYFKSIENSEVNRDTHKIIVPETRSFINIKTLMKTYKIFGVAKKLPYINYDQNESEVNCFYNYVSKIHTKISKKKKDLLNKNEGVTLDDVKQYCEEYKIKCILYNIAGKKIYSNEVEQNKNHKSIIAIISNKHIYPFINNNNSKSYTPSLNEKKGGFDLEDEDYLNNNIIFQVNDNCFSEKGKMNIVDIENEMDNILFKSLKPNFTYENDTACKISPLIYSNENLKNMKFEYDIKKCYFNIAYNHLDKNGSYPIFTFKDFWEIYDPLEHIDENNYYTLKEEATKKLNIYGINDNIRIGKMILLLIENKLIEQSDIEYVKKYSYSGKWDFVLNRLDLLLNNVVKKKLNITEDKYKITEDDIKRSEIDKNYVFYNGLLGRTTSETRKKIFFLNEDDYHLLNMNEKEEWTFSGSGDHCIFEKSYLSFKNLNNVTIYNNIVEEVNIIIIKNILYIKQKYDTMPLKIKTDSISFDKEIKLLPKFKDYFKLELEKPEKAKNAQKLDIKQKKLFRKHFSNSTYIHDIKEINKNIEQYELKKINSSVITGPPGTGKTYKIKNNYKYDISCTMTNICALNISSENIKASTLFSLLRMFDPDAWINAMKCLQNKILWIDEFSMVPLIYWNFIFLCASKYNTKLIITGDINQIAPIGENKINIENNIPLKYLFQNIEVLNKDYRNDEKIIKLRNRVLNDDGNRLKKLFQKIDASNYEGNEWYNVDRHLCLKDDTRIFINNTILEKRKLNFIVECDKKGIVTKCDISKGVLLTCRITMKSKNIFKGDTYKYDCFLNGLNHMFNYRTKQINTFNKDDMKYFKLGFANTTHSVQGLTIEDEFCIHEVKLMLFIDKDVLYTAITRAINYENIQCYYNQKYGKNPKEKLPYIVTEDGEENIPFRENENFDFGQKINYNYFS